MTAALSEARVPKYIAELVAAIEGLWAGAGRGSAILSSVAAQALEEVEAPEFGARDLLAYFATEDSGRLPTETKLADQFGQPPAVLDKGPEFFIQALTWMEGTTSIHQHGFCGGVQGDGRSEPSRPVPIRPGRTGCTGAGRGRPLHGHPEILNVGDVRAIVPGPGFIHALFHLVRPSSPSWCATLRAMSVLRSSATEGPDWPTLLRITTCCGSVASRPLMPSARSIPNRGCERPAD